MSAGNGTSTRDAGPGRRRTCRQPRGPAPDLGSPPSPFRASWVISWSTLLHAVGEATTRTPLPQVVLPRPFGGADELDRQHSRSSGWRSSYAARRHFSEHHFGGLPRTPFDSGVLRTPGTHPQGRSYVGTILVMATEAKYVTTYRPSRGSADSLVSLRRTSCHFRGPPCNRVQDRLNFPTPARPIRPVAGRFITTFRAAISTCPMLMNFRVLRGPGGREYDFVDFERVDLARGEAIDG